MKDRQIEEIRPYSQTMAWSARASTVSWPFPLVFLAMQTVRSWQYMVRLPVGQVSPLHSLSGIVSVIACFRQPHEDLTIQRQLASDQSTT